MKERLPLKVGIIISLVLLLLIPLQMIRGVIDERSDYREQARTSIADSWTGSQKLLGPVLVVPYVESYTERVWDEHLKAYTEEPRTRAREIFILPEEVKITGSVATEKRSRGLYGIPVYSASLALEGRFTNQRVLDTIKQTQHGLTWKRPFLALVVSDNRGIVTEPVLKWGGEQVPFVSGSGIEQLSNGMRAELGPLSTDKAQSYPFNLAFDLHGMESIQFAPVGKSTRVTLQSDWPHPSFDGRYLPSDRQISENSFTANWKVSSFSSDMERAVDQCQRGNCTAFAANTFGVTLVDPVDVYQQTDRAVKYAVLFIGLTFVAFFLYEIMKGLRLHPMQYLLVGMALTVFYLLLISLSEHIAFKWAYLVAVVASSGLIGVYLAAILSSRRLASAFTAVLWLLYGMLFAILQSEDNALVMGSLLIFGVLAFVMLVTRKLDWYRLSGQMTRQTASPPAVV